MGGTEEQNAGFVDVLLTLSPLGDLSLLRASRVEGETWKKYVGRRRQTGQRPQEKAEDAGWTDRTDRSL